MSISAAPGYAGDPDSKAKHLARLKRIEGQIRGIGRMVEEEKYCIDVLTQISAATAALHSLSISLLTEHMNECVVSAARESEAAGQEKVAEASAAIARLIKS